MTRRHALAAMAAAVVWLGGCSADAGGDRRTDAAATPTTTEATRSTVETADSTTTSPPEASTTAPAQSGEPGPGCINGWVTPSPGTPLRSEPLDLIRLEMGVTGRFHILEIRFFTSPEVPWIISPRPPLVQWWYVKAELVDEAAFRARWLVARRSPAIAGIAAVARFDSTGYGSPDWRAFLGGEAGDERRSVEGLPGTWIGFEYDFVTGEDGEKPGLPDEVVNCLDGT